MNKFQKSIDYTTWVIEDVSYMMLSEEYAIVGGYDYKEKSLFRFCRKRLKQLIKEKNFSIEDIKTLRSNLYENITRPLCEDIAKEYSKRINNTRNY